MEISDGGLVGRYRNGDVQALETLVERYRRQLFGFIVNMTGGGQDAEELFQEVWLRAIRKIDTYRDRYFLAWLVRIARNLVIDRWRSRKPEESLEQSVEEGRHGDEFAAAVADPAEAVGAKDTAALVAMAIEELPLEQKEVVLMRLKAEMPFREIARIQGVSLNTALARMQYGLAKLKRSLDGELERELEGADRRRGGKL